MDPVISIPDAPERPDDPAVTWRWWEAVVVFIIGALVGGVLSVPGIAIVDSKKLQDLILAGCSEVGLGSTAFLWLWFLHRRSIRALGIPVNVRREAGIGALAGIGLYAVGVFVVGLIVSVVLQETSNRNVHSPRQLPTHLTGPELVLAAFTVIIVAPIAEELLFRGILFRSLRARHSFMFAGVISAVFFGLVHFPGGAWQNALLLPIVMLFVGFGLAWLYEWRGNIVANIAAHSAFNVIGFLFIWLAVAR